MAEQRERRAIAEQYREQLAQLLVGMKFRATVVAQRHRLAADPDWTALVGLLDHAVRDALLIGGSLAPHVLDGEELLPTLHWLVAWMQDRYGFTVALTAPATVCLRPEPLQLLLVHAIRHLLVNAATHAQVRRAALAVAQQNGALQITVSDDGIGFDPVRVSRTRGDRRVGLASVQQMVDYLGAR